ncbi:MAG: leucine--tRNA ligase [Bacilli bacterium]
MGYDFSSIEKKWQKYWEENETFKCDVYDFDKPKYYIMDMFPYPSAQGLHVGHIEGYSATDAEARFKRAQGFNVLHPIGFDSFGLPAEQYAIKNNKHPGPFTDKNIANFVSQLKSCGLSYDWSKQIQTSDPSYYKWTQWIFIKLFENGLAYMDNRPVNYCPELGTVLANEEVVNGRSERGNFPVIKLALNQWVLKITAYAQKLLDDLPLLDWPESTIAMQRNWIGKSKGVEIEFDVVDSTESFQVFTTRVDTLFGCTYVVLAPEHKLVKKITAPECQAAVDAYLDSIKSKSDLERTALSKEKTGVFIGAYAINPINGKKVPIYIGDYVLATYGSGAVMAVPCHDERDYEFAKKHSIEFIQVIEGDVSNAAMIGDGKHINSDYANGLNNKEAAKVITEHLVAMKKGKEKVNYKLRDWLFSRQRYWGEPIPVVHLDDGEIVPVNYDELPVTLPELDNYAPTGDGKPPLEKATDWVNVQIDGKHGKRETNIMPQWAGSSWYYIRYLDPHNDREIADPKLISHWLPVDLYIGGAEHAVLHLLYARFWHKFLYDQGIVKCKEPFKKLYHQGMVLGSNGVKMSKSLGNVVNPNDCIKEFGADSLRLYELFKGPIDQSLPWSETGLSGANRFLNRVYRLYTDERFVSKWTDKDDGSLDFEFNFTIKKVTEDYEALHFNTAIAQIMIFVNALYQAKSLCKHHLVVLAQLLNPIVPHIASEIYELIGKTDCIEFAKWPEYDESKCVLDEITLPVSVNGKHRGNLKIKRDFDNKDELVKKAQEVESISRYTEGKEIFKVIFVKNKILNILVK